MIKLFEFVLWNNCPNNCKFCYLKNEYQSVKEDMLDVVSLVSRFVDGINEDSSVLLTGGEMFANLNAEVYNELVKLYDKIYKNNYIKMIFFNTNLLYDINKYLIPVLDLACNLSVIDKIHFTTSDDFDGRFDGLTRKLFYDNLAKIRERYKNLIIIVNSILTDKFCDEIIGGRYNIVDYCNKHKVTVNVVPYIDVNNIKEYLPKKDKVIQCLITLKKQNPEWFDGYIDIFSRERNMYVYQYDSKNKCLVDSTSRFLKCKHSENFSHCFDDGSCFACLLEALK